MLPVQLPPLPRLPTGPLDFTACQSLPPGSLCPTAPFFQPVEEELAPCPPAVDNHDTGSTQAHWPWPSDRVMLGYAFILTHPGVPCGELLTWAPAPAQP